LQLSFHEEFSALCALLSRGFGNLLDRKAEPGRQPAKIPGVRDAAMLDLVHRLPRERTEFAFHDGHALYALSRLF